jgi:cation diffusion facilitator family transporter
MVNFLAKLFIKDYRNIESEKVRNKYGVLAGVFGIISNFILFVIKIIIGLISTSISIIADAINNLSDMGSSLLTLVGFKISGKPADKDHPFGHQRIEYIIGLIIAMLIIFIGFELFTTSIDKLINPVESSMTIPVLIILVIAIIFKFLQGLFYSSVAKKINSIALKASSKDSMNDVISTSFVLLGALLSYFFTYNFDGIFGIVVSGLIIITGIKLVKEGIDPLIGEKPDKDLMNKVVSKVLSYDGVLGIHDLMAHMYGPQKCFVSLHVEVDSKVDVLLSHDLIDNIEKEVKEELNVELVIHMDPIETNNETLMEYVKILKEVVSEIDDSIRFHDVRLVIGETHKNLIFDLLVSFEFKYTDEELISLVKTKICEKDPIINCVIQIDKDYVENI